MSITKVYEKYKNITSILVHLLETDRLYIHDYIITMIILIQNATENKSHQIFMENVMNAFLLLHNKYKFMN